MSSLHLTTDSDKPAEVEGLARLYSMTHCPFAHRIRLILTLKDVPHDIVNINLKNKPDWYFEINPKGTVPSYIDTNGEIITDSLLIANYLDEKYPEPALYNEETKNRDLELLDNYTKIAIIFKNCLYDEDKRQLEEIVAEIMDYLDEYEQELNIRQTPFFGGSNPGILDILMWPWVERAKALPLLYKQSAGFDKERFPMLMKWIVEMKEQPFVKENKSSYEQFAEHIETVRSGNPEYDF
ncbi:PREDICTED: pyrimidodiazepine synthase-like [Dinoponera quadriceps]|uniref:Pyrimidodiazepine synthase-like n=1 Tax=Dinoponera quadriceps TaxID=609295 RepID=A0A6P3Y6H8_DINQU|nr:PREDICTED: pyrimidodiazepine synthase-like [Dinoponera quadriceps]